MKKLEMKYGPFIYTIYLMSWIRFKKELVTLRLCSEKLLTFVRDFPSYRSLPVQL